MWRGPDGRLYIHKYCSIVRLLSYTVRSTVLQYISVKTVSSKWRERGMGRSTRVAGVVSPWNAPGCFFELRFAFLATKSGSLTFVRWVLEFLHQPRVNTPAFRMGRNGTGHRQFQKKVRKPGTTCCAGVVRASEYRIQIQSLECCSIFLLAQYGMNTIYTFSSVYPVLVPKRIFTRNTKELHYRA